VIRIEELLGDFGQPFDAPNGDLIS